jgi:hypothetical protein
MNRIEKGGMDMNPIHSGSHMDNQKAGVAGVMGGHDSLLAMVQHCEATCEHMVTHLICAHHDNRRDLQIQLLRDCADICTLMAKYLARNSCHARMLAHVCATICENCGNECAKFPDMISQQCAEICFHCAQACRMFAG